MLLLTLLHPGTIKELFQTRHTVKGPRRYDPLGLTVVQSQCVHVETDMLSDYYFVRCANDIVLDRHGWLCPEHQPVFVKPRRYLARDRDVEIVAGILAYEQRALAHARRCVVQVGAKTRIDYVAN